MANAKQLLQYKAANVACIQDIVMPLSELVSGHGGVKSLPVAPVIKTVESWNASRTLYCSALCDECLDTESL